ncbi:hypothetical protein M8C21_027798 [Ambrosia artemisiifolia]|uniref:Uncharacterized protein n=1 Tax=Ambrosia artemisiifolia TaxID=4212 RepID=A0AAD5CZD1_AMBAR|nr:hypothetical protein M8C21_027798 [Ambrosia artemisiifolia]
MADLLTTTTTRMLLFNPNTKVLVTGGEDHKVNLWAIGKPNAILLENYEEEIVQMKNISNQEYDAHLRNWQMEPVRKRGVLRKCLRRSMGTNVRICW